MDSIALIELLKLKNEKAISYLYDRYSSSLYGVILRMVKSREKAEVILENTFSAILDNAYAYQDHTRNLFAWMVGIARITAQQCHASSDPVEHGMGEYNSVERCCPELLEGMEVQSKSVLLHIYFLNHTIPETSILLDIPQQHIKVLLKSALSHVQNQLSTSHLSLLTLFIFLL